MAGFYPAALPQDSNAMHAKPDLRVVLKWTIAGSGSVIADVIQLDYRATTYSESNASPILNSRVVIGDRRCCDFAYAAWQWIWICRVDASFSCLRNAPNSRIP